MVKNRQDVGVQGEDRQRLASEVQDVDVQVHIGGDKADCEEAGTGRFDHRVQKEAGSEHKAEGRREGEGEARVMIFFCYYVGPTVMYNYN